jgi:hypothetical protein
VRSDAIGAERAALLHVAALRGVVRSHGFENSLNRETSGVASDVESLVAQALLRTLELPGGQAAVIITPAGRLAHQEWLQSEGLRDPQAAARLRDLYPGFSVVNERIKRVCSAWQVHLDEPGTPTNDHADSAYDAKVLNDLRLAHTDALVVCTEIGRALARMSGYGERLAHSIAAIEAGDLARFVGVGNESYHHVWMELHQDLLLTLGLEHTAADA